jgi:hypothetical protein
MTIIETVSSRGKRVVLGALVAAAAGCSASSVVNGGVDAAAGSVGRMSDAASGGGGDVVPLPMTVTSFYNNQGWFGDAAVAASFTTGSMVIQQGDSSSGACAARDPGARGKCLQVIYTPPAGLTPPMGGGYVGVFFLTTLTMAHPELSPPANLGEANWGAEPGKAIAPGATQISFFAASASAGLSVTFKAGTDKDSFVLPETAETLGTTWQKVSLPLGGQSYGSSVIGAFAWVLKDTTHPATFYLDGIVWEK